MSTNLSYFIAAQVGVTVLLFQLLSIIKELAITYSNYTIMKEIIQKVVVKKIIGR